MKLVESVRCQGELGHRSTTPTTVDEVPACATPVPSSPTCVGTATLESKLVECSSGDESSLPRGRKRSRTGNTIQRSLARLVSHESDMNLEGMAPCISSGGEEDDDCASFTSAAGNLEGTEMDVFKCDPSVLADAQNTSRSTNSRGLARCVSQLGILSTKMDAASTEAIPPSPSTDYVPCLPNPLHQPSVLSSHVRSLRLETELVPMRLLLSRLMAHPTHNRNGVFNVPVDPVALGLPDYDRIVKKPMDLGTVKARLPALAYTSREDVANDIRLVFRNAMLYNPCNNLVHISARELLAIFDEAFLDIQIKSGQAPEPARVKNDTTSKVSRAHVFLRSEGPVPSTSEDLAFRGNVAVEADPSVRKVVASIISVNQIPAAPATLQNISSNFKPADALYTKFATRKALVSSLSVNQIGPDLLTVPDQANISKPKKKPRQQAKKLLPHSCNVCFGRTCRMCEQGCLSHEPALLICTGSNCGSAKIRKGAVYYITPDGARQFCQRCFTNLAAVLPHEKEYGDSWREGSPVRYKRDLLKRKNDEEVVEEWLTCVQCKSSIHRICAMFNEFVHCEKEFVCPFCVSRLSCQEEVGQERKLPDELMGGANPSSDEVYTFVSGSETPVSLSEFQAEHVVPGCELLSSDSLPECSVSSFIEEKVRNLMKSSGITNAEHTVTVRVISDCDKSFSVPEVVRKHFRMAVDESESHFDATGVPPSLVRYKSKAIALFQRIDGLDVCIFCMYVQEYDGDDQYDNMDDYVIPQKKRVYIAYLDSVEYFRPRPCRTEVYHEMMISYLATARALGYETAHIWACPPTRGNSFVFWSHPNSQRTPTKDRLVAWYHGALSNAIERGVVTDVKSLYECAFHDFMSRVKEDDLEDRTTHSFEDARPGRMLCPPLLDGDYWVEEALRLHNVSLSRYLKSKVGAKETSCAGGAEAVAQHLQAERCPAVQIASILRNRIMAHPSSAPFRRPVNASSLKLKDYHRIITRPMDLGTVYARCVLGEFDTLVDLVSDVLLVFDNAMRYNPKGHEVHRLADEMRSLFLKEIADITASWSCQSQFPDATLSPAKRFADMSMSLDLRLDEPAVKSELNATEESADATSKEMPHSDSISFSEPDVPSAKANDEAAIDAVPSRPIQKPDLLTGGPDAVLRHMVGDDVWLLDKRYPYQSKKSKAGKKKATGKRKQAFEAWPEESTSNKRRRQSWLCEEVGSSLRRFRTSFFTCSLLPKSHPSELEKQKLDHFNSYVASFLRHQRHWSNGDSPVIRSRIANARHALLEFSQYRNFEFDTLRRAKYSTAMLLYHLHNDDAPGLVPICTCCGDKIQHVRWHKTRKPGAASKAAPVPEELCTGCFSKSSNGKAFIPLPVSFKL